MYKALLCKAKSLGWRLSLLVALCLVGIGVAQAQTRAVKGVVVDATTGEPIIGANLIIQGTTTGVATGFDGDFELKVSQGQTIKVSYVGYNDLLVKASDFKAGQPLTVRLREAANALTELVVTGYGGAVSRAKVTNAIAKVDKEVFSKGVFSNPAQALSGAVAGLRVTQTSGAPGSTPSLVIRGGTNLDGSGSPLVIIDGVIRSMSDINSNDIEDMQVLKDAGATAIYGARASNGVILITTKKGKAGHRSINFKASYGLSYINDPYKFLGARDYLYWARKAMHETPWLTNKGILRNAGQPMSTGNDLSDDNRLWNVALKTDANAHLLEKGWEEMVDPLNAEQTLIFKHTNPRDGNIVNPAKTQDYNLSFAGGNDKGSYYSGIGYNHAEGLPVGSFYKRFNFTFNGSYKVADFITASSNFNFTKANWKNASGLQTNIGNYFGRVSSLPPTVRYSYDDGRPFIGRDAQDGNQSYQPDKFLRDNQTDKFSMVQSLEIRPFKGLSIKGTGNWFYSEGFYESFTKDYENKPGDFIRTRSTSASYDRTVQQTYNLIANYKTQIASKHGLDAMVGTEYFDEYARGLAASGEGAPSDDFQALNLTTDQEGKRAISSYHLRQRILSYLGRVNYDYDNKYLLSFTFRNDGYSRLLGDNRWGFFPGMSAGWVFGKESFAKQALPFLSFGKLRLSYGLSGNASGIGVYELQGAYNAVTYNGKKGYRISALPNPALSWEKTRTFDIGLDLSFFDNRLTTNFTYYDRLTRDKYAALTLISTSGFSSVRDNNGEFSNRGLEFEYSAKLISTKDLALTVSGNFAYNKNKIISLPNNGLLRNRQGGIEIYTGNGDDKVFVGGYQEGQEPGLLVGYVAEGYFQKSEDIPANYKDKSMTNNGKEILSPALYAAAPDKSKVIEARPGDVRWKDVNGDGIIDQYDQVVFGNTLPRWTGGFNTNLSWKGLTLAARLDFALGFWRYDGQRGWFLGNMQGTYNSTTDVFDTWTPENPNAKYPRYVWADQLGAANFNRTSSIFASKGDYLAFRELSLSYDLPQAFLKKIHAKAISLSVTAQNLGYLTAGSRVASPEVSSAGSGYALPRTILFGVNITY